MDLDNLMRLRIGRHVHEIPRQKQMHYFSEYAWRADDFPHGLPMAGAQARLLFQFTLRGGQGRLARIQLAGGQFPQPAAGRVPVLPQQADTILVIERHHGGASGVADDLKLGHRAVRKRDPLQIKVDDFSAVNSRFIVRHVSSPRNRYSLSSWHCIVIAAWVRRWASVRRSGK